MFFLFFVLAGCLPNSPAGTPTPTVPISTLIPYRTSTPAANLESQLSSTSPSLPTPSATPRTHVVGADELGSSIALQYGVSLAALQAANPGVDLNFLKVSSTLIIPASDSTLQAGLATPTPESVLVGSPVCSPTADQGAWCLMDIHNSREIDLGAITVEMTVSSSGSESFRTEKAALLVDVLPSQAQLPVVIYFSGPFKWPVTASGKILSALPQPSQAGDVVKATVTADPQIAADGLTAQISGTATLPQASSGIQEIWIVAAGYDSTGRPVGVRKIMLPVENPAVPLPFTLNLYSAGGKIDRIVLLGEGHRS